MSGLPGLLQLVFLTAVTVAFAVMAATAIARPVLQRGLRKLHPARRSRALALIAAAPILIATLHALVCFVPGFLGLIWPALGHCLFHEHEGYSHMCGSNSVQGAAALMVAVAGAAVVVSVVWPLLRFVVGWVDRHRRLRQLNALARYDHATGAWVVTSDRPLAFAFGSRVFLSTALLTGIPAHFLAAVLGHERAHLRRRDPVRGFVAGLVTFFHLPRTGTWLRAEFALAAEQACDEEAAREVGDRMLVAGALLAVERLASNAALNTPSPAYAFGGASVVARVESLLAPPATVGPRTLEAIVYATCLATALLASDPVHHLTESLLSLAGG